VSVTPNEVEEALMFLYRLLGLRLSTHVTSLELFWLAFYLSQQQNKEL
jgi:hypothetical protein